MLRRLSVALWLCGSFTPVWLLVAATAAAADPAEYLSPGGQHRLFQGSMPAGTIAATRQMMGPNYGQPYYQPVHFVGAGNMQFAMPLGGAMTESESGLMAGLMVGHVYRFMVTNIPDAPGTELFPTIEMVDRTFPPQGLETSYPIPISIDADDIAAALDGQLVTRVIYLEDPQTAIAMPQQPLPAAPIDISEYQDPLNEADRVGRVVAILRIGSLAPPQQPELAHQFYFGFPMWAPIVQSKSVMRGQP